MLIALLRANSGKPFFQYRFNLWQKITLSKNSAIIRCYSEVMTSPFYLVKLESFTLKVCQLELKKGCQPKLLFERFGAISNIVRPFHALFARISCNTFLESLKHTDQPRVWGLIFYQKRPQPTVIRLQNSGMICKTI